MKRSTVQSCPVAPIMRAWRNGRRTSFRYWRVKPCRFDSYRSHHSADVAELVDAPDLGSGDESRGGSTPFIRTIFLCPSGGMADAPASNPGAVKRVQVQVLPGAPICGPGGTVDAPALRSGANVREGSTPSARTICSSKQIKPLKVLLRANSSTRRPGTLWAFTRPW